MKVRIQATPYLHNIRKTGEDINEKLFLKDTKLHIDAVRNLMQLCISDMQLNARKHDWTKISHADVFLKSYRDGNISNDSEWYKMHTEKEPHHILDTPQSVTLMDCIEACCDWVSAGKARSDDGKFKLRQIDQEKLKGVLFKAFMNTISYLDSNSETVKSDASIMEGGISAPVQTTSNGNKEKGNLKLPEQTENKISSRTAPQSAGDSDELGEGGVK